MTARSAGDSPQSFATWVVQQLQEHGFQALFAGGCVRDQLMGREPQDYDVATAARPEQVRDVFGKRRTIAIGAAFGVITVIGNRQSGNVEVATFRSDGQYSDGRRPDAVHYTDAENDALRRDFAINGLFYDPMADLVLDFVDGQSDIEHRIIRAIGDAAERFGEDKLRMLRAIRFATTLGFEIEALTFQAIGQQASEIQRVSGERIAAEMFKLLQAENRATGLSLLSDCGLASWILPEFAELPSHIRQALLEQVAVFQMGHWIPEWTLALMIWAAEFSDSDGDQVVARFDDHWNGLRDRVRLLVKRWKLSNQSRDVMVACLADSFRLIRMTNRPWSEIQPILVGRWAPAVVGFSQWLAAWLGESDKGVQQAQDCLKLPQAELDPPPLITGHQMLEMGVPKGPRTGQWLRKVRQMQLDNLLSDSEEAVRFVQNHLGQGNDSPPNGSPGAGE